MELDGYLPDATLPPYRKWLAILKGDFSGPFGSSLKQAPVPATILPESLRESLRTIYWRHSISSTETLLTKSGSDPIKLDANDLTPYIGNRIYDGYNCIQLWREFSSSNFEELLNAVRNRVLDFTLGLEKEAASAGDDNADAIDIQPERITQIFQTTIHGGVANIVGSAFQSPISVHIAQRSLDKLKELLASRGLSESDLRDLEASIQEDDIAGATTNEQFGPKVSDWIARMVKHAASGTWDLSVGAAGSLLAEALAQYYGWPS